VSTEKIFVLKSIIVGLLIGLVVYVFNTILIPLLQGLSSSISNIHARVRLAHLTKGIRTKITELENLNRNLLEVDDEIKSVTSLTIREVQVEYGLGQVAQGKSFVTQPLSDMEEIYA
jgi:hypothetical protein